MSGFKGNELQLKVLLWFSALAIEDGALEALWMKSWLLMKRLYILCVDEAWLHHCHHPVDGLPNHQRNRIMSLCGIIKEKNPFAGIVTLFGVKRSAIIYSNSCFALAFVLYYFTLFTWPSSYTMICYIFLDAFWQLLICPMCLCRAPTNNYRHHPLIWLLFPQLIN